MNLKKEKIEKILITINPKIKPFLKKKNYKLVDEGLIDSFSIIQILLEIEKIKKKKINTGKINREHFQNLENILKLFNKK